MVRLYARLLLLALGAIGSLMLASCSAHPPASNGSSTNEVSQGVETSAPAPVTDITNDPGSTYNVTFKSSTVMVDQKTVANSLLAVSDDGSILVFDDSSPQIQALAAGDVVLFKKIGLRRVTAVERRNNAVFVTVGQAALTDAIQNGHIAWNFPVNFGSMSQVSMSDWQSGEPVAYDPIGEWLRRHGEPALAQGESGGDNGKEFEFREWKITANIQPAGNRLDVDLKLTRENIMGMDVEVHGHGYLNNFNSVDDMQIGGGELQSMDYSASGLNGHIDFDWTASKSTPGVGTLDPSEQIIKLQRPKVAIHFLIGEFPFALEFSVASIVKLGFSGKGEVAHGSFSVDYNGDAGFTTSGSVAKAKPGAVNGDAAVNETSTGVSIGSFGLVVAIAIPKIELKTDFEIEPAENNESSSQMSEGENAIEGSGQESNFSKFLTKVGKTVRKGVQKLLENEAGVYVEFIVSTGLSKESNAEPGVIPCTNTTLVFSYKYGAELKMIGVTLAEPNSGVQMLKKLHHIDPPIQRCKDIATANGG